MPDFEESIKENLPSICFLPLSFDAKTIKTIENDISYQLDVEVNTQDGVLKFSPSIIKIQGVWAIHPSSAYFKPIN